MAADISIVIPMHNARRWVGTALDSVMEQREVSFEFIIVDDGSTDDSAVVAERVARGKASCRLLRNERNIGIVASLNRGLDSAQGKFIARMDADDICAPNRLARQVQFMQQTGVDLCGSWFVEFGQGLPRTVRWPHTETALRAAMLFQNSICHPTLMARREVFDRYRYREEYRLAEDYDLYSRAMADFRMANVPEALLRYRRHPGQATQARRDAMEIVTKRIRIEVLASQGISATEDERRLHNLIRAPESIIAYEDLLGIEAWLIKLIGHHEDPESKREIASQWVRACVRAAPLGRRMLRAYHASPLRQLAAAGTGAALDLLVLATIRLDYRSKSFAVLRRLGISA